MKGGSGIRGYESVSVIIEKKWNMHLPTKVPRKKSIRGTPNRGEHILTNQLGTMGLNRNKKIVRPIVLSNLLIYNEGVNIK